MFSFVIGVLFTVYVHLSKFIELYTEDLCISLRVHFASR